MDAHLFRAFCSVFMPFLQGARIEKIQEPNPGLFTMTLYGGSAKKQLYWHYGRQNPFCFISDTRLGANHMPPASIMRIRKYFNQRHIASTLVQFCQRKIWLMAASSQTEAAPSRIAWLCLDLAGGPELHFLDINHLPEADNPTWPQPDELAEALTEWRQWPVLTPALRKYLHNMEEPDQWALMEDLRRGDGDIFYSSGKNPDGTSRVTRVAAWPLMARENETVYSATNSEILETLEKAGQNLVLEPLYASAHERILAPVRKRIAQLTRLLAKLDQDEARLRHMADREKDGLALRANLWRWQTGAKLEKIVIEEANDTREIALDKRFDILRNMERFFHESKRGKRGLAMLEDRRRHARAELDALNDPNQTIPADNTAKNPQTHRPEQDAGLSAPANVQVLHATDGHVIMRGKDAKGNQTVRRLAAPHDMWVHVETGPGAHVIIRRRYPAEELSPELLDEAGALAASKSWLKDAPTASVMYAENRHVKTSRKGPAGRVTIDRIAMTRLVKTVPDIENRLASSGKAR